MSDDVLGPIPRSPEDATIVADAVRLFLKARFGPGDVIKWAWLYEALQVPLPESVNDADTRDRWRLRFVGLKAEFGKALLTQHEIALDTVVGVGVRWVPPGEQTGWAGKEMMSELRRTLSKSSARLNHVNQAML